ncbi:MAG: hypothetical protein L0Y80_02135 [Ignavibacteriae bacterium]|nr:hypothetical protein [Ignavibacteriota bacterium]
MKIFSAILILVLTVVVSVSAFAQTSATQVLTLEVKAINKIAVTGNPQPLVINDIPAGVESATVSDYSTTYDVTTNMENMKIVASINSPLPSGMQLMVDLGSDQGSTAGLVDVSNATTPVNVVTGIQRGSDASQAIGYVFTAYATAGTMPSDSRVVTLTISE